MEGKWKYIRNDTYRRGVTIVIGDNELLVRFLENSIYSEDKDFILRAKESTAWATCYNDKNDGQCIIRIDKFPKTPGLIACLGHELLHAVFFILEYCGVEYSKESEEAYTYLYEFFLNKALTDKGYKKI